MFRGEFHSRIIPRERSHRKATHAPNVPIVQKGKLDLIAIFVPPGARKNLSGLVEGETIFTNSEGNSSITKGELLTPITKLSLTPEYKTMHGGGRVGGGGTSEKALSSAKKHSKKR